MNTGTASPCKAYGMQWDIGLKLKSLDHASHFGSVMFSCAQKSLMAPSGPLTLMSKMSFLCSNIHDQTLCKGMSGSSVSTLSPDISSVIAMFTGTDMVSFPERYLCRSLWQLPGHWPLCPNLDKLINSGWKAPSATAAEANCCNKGAAISPQAHCSSNVEANLLCLRPSSGAASWRFALSLLYNGGL